jgi:hypothetical protein
MGLMMASACLSPQAFARNGYNTEFWNSYPSLKEHKETKCGACHGKDKKVTNDYGKAFGQALGDVKVTNVDKIKAALEKAEAAKSATDGKTFGELIKEGKLPGKAP